MGILYGYEVSYDFIHVLTKAFYKFTWAFCMVTKCLMTLYMFDQKKGNGQHYVVLDSFLLHI